jgi:hypothetical protein
VVIPASSQATSPLECLIIIRVKNSYPVLYLVLLCVRCCSECLIAITPWSRLCLKMRLLSVVEEKTESQSGFSRPRGFVCVCERVQRKRAEFHTRPCSSRALLFAIVSPAVVLFPSHWPCEVRDCFFPRTSFPAGRLSYGEGPERCLRMWFRTGGPRLRGAGFCSSSHVFKSLFLGPHARQCGGG